MPDELGLSSLARFLLVDLSPYVLMSAFFFGLYVSMPNTHVEWRCAIVPGIVAGIAMQWLQLFYVHSQLWVTGYNAIYGSFAALPLFMLWVQISWTICLFGAEMTYTNQHMKRLGINIEQPDFHPYVEMGDNERSNEAIAHYADGIDGL
jgi:membrane protein